MEKELTIKFEKESLNFLENVKLETLKEDCKNFEKIEEISEVNSNSDEYEGIEKLNINRN